MIAAAASEFIVTKSLLSPRVYCHQEFIVTKSLLSLRVYCHQEFIVTKNLLSPRVYCHQKFIVTKSLLSLRVYCHQEHQEFIVTKSLLSPRVYCHQEFIVTRKEIKYVECSTAHHFVPLAFESLGPIVPKPKIVQKSSAVAQHSQRTTAWKLQICSAACL